MTPSLAPARIGYLLQKLQQPGGRSLQNTPPCNNLQQISQSIPNDRLSHHSYRNIHTFILCAAVLGIPRRLEKSPRIEDDVGSVFWTGKIACYLSKKAAQISLKTVLSRAARTRLRHPLRAES